MRSRMAFIHSALLSTTLAVTMAVPAAAEPVCQTVFPDGSVIFTRPVIVNGSLSCFSPTVGPRMHRSDAARFALPSMSFTTGPVGRFTTGEIGPFTTGEIGPFTTFSNSESTTSRHR